MSTEPRTLDEYNARFKDNYHLEGFGLEVTIHWPCPMCAAPDWYVGRLMDNGWAQPTKCEECGRTSAHRQEAMAGSGVRGWLALVDGPDAPEYLDLEDGVRVYVDERAVSA